MAGVPRYKGGNINVGGGAELVGKAQASSMDTFLNGISNLKGNVMGMVQDDAVQRAKADAQEAFTTRGLEANVNNELNAYGDGYTNTLNNLHKKQVSIDTNTRMKEIFTSAENDPKMFKEQSDAYYKETSSKLPEHLKADYAIEFEANKANYFGKVKENRIRLDKEKDYSTNKTLFMTHLEEATKHARDGNGARSLYSVTQAEAKSQDSLDKGYISAVDHENNMVQINQDVTRANFKGVNDGYIESNNLEAGQDFINGFRKAKVPGYDDKQREALADDMQSDLNREIARQQAGNKVREKYDNAEAKDTIYLYNNGEEVANETFQRLMNSNVSPLVKEDLALALADNGKMKIFNAKGLEDESNDIVELRANKSKTADELRLLKKKEKAYIDNAKAIDNDPVTYSDGKAYDTELQPLILGDEKFMEKSIEREEQVKLSRAYTKRDHGFFTKPEITSVKSQFKTMDLQGKMGVLEMINGLDPEIATATYKQLGGDMSFSGNLALAGNDTAAKYSLLGKGADVILPEGFLIDLKEKIGNVYGGYNPEYYNENIDGITNYAKGLIMDGEPADSIDDVITQSIGKVVKYNNKRTVLPFDVSEKKFESWLDNIKLEGRPALTKGLNDISDVFGNGDYQLHHAGNGEYIVKYNNNGNISTVLDKEDPTKPYILRYGE